MTIEQAIHLLMILRDDPRHGSDELRDKLIAFLLARIPA